MFADEQLHLSPFQNLIYFFKIGTVSDSSVLRDKNCHSLFARKATVSIPRDISSPTSPSNNSTANNLF